MVVKRGDESLGIMMIDVWSVFKKTGTKHELSSRGIDMC